MATFKIVQIGCGVVGSAYMRAFQSKGNEVIGLEASKKLIDDLSTEGFEMYHVSQNDELEKLSGLDFILLSINTPLNKETGKLELKYLRSSLDNVATMVKSNPDVSVVIRSTVPAGFTEEYRTSLEKKVDQHVNVLFQPEFLRAQSAVEDAMYPWYVIVGHFEDTDPVGFSNLYKQFISEKYIEFMKIEEAEVMKLFHNSFNAAKISWFNQANLLVKAMNKTNGTEIDIDVITNAMTFTCEGLKNVRYGTKSGHGYYGTCLPKDSAELQSQERQYLKQDGLFSHVVKVNDHMVSEVDTEEHLYGDCQVSHKDMVN